MTCVLSEPSTPDTVTPLPPREGGRGVRFAPAIPGCGPASTGCNRGSAPGDTVNVARPRYNPCPVAETQRDISQGSLCTIVWRFIGSHPKGAPQWICHRSDHEVGIRFPAPHGPDWPLKPVPWRQGPTIVAHRRGYEPTPGWVSQPAVGDILGETHPYSAGQPMTNLPWCSSQNDRSINGRQRSHTANPRSRNDAMASSG